MTDLKHVAAYDDSLPVKPGTKESNRSMTCILTVLAQFALLEITPLEPLRKSSVYGGVKYSHIVAHVA